MKSIQNKFYVFLVFIVFSCSVQNNQNEQLKGTEILGEWKQVNMRILDDDGHMATPNKWVFRENTCMLNIANPRVYNYIIKNQEIKLDKVKGEVYEEWENILFFERSLSLKITDTTMLWLRKDTLEVSFERY